MTHEKKAWRASELVAAGVVPTKVTLYRWVREGRFPRPLKPGPFVSIWLHDDIEQWLAGLREAR